jgi:hypothetical protein
MDFDFTMIYAAALFAHTRQATAAELRVCRNCPTWGDVPHVCAAIVRDLLDTLDFFESYYEGASRPRRVAA